ncbi:MAG: metallophosphoesterase family protein [Defluviitaleaceae bacterium]|nr:metallophosphoesterase family protein [Defluviitaleaceae bacterium]
MVFATAVPGCGSKDAAPPTSAPIATIQPTIPPAEPEVSVEADEPKNGGDESDDAELTGGETDGDVAVDEPEADETEVEYFYFDFEMPEDDPVAVTLTLQPGKNAAELNFNWLGDSGLGNAPAVHIVKKSQMVDGVFPEGALVFAGVSGAAYEGMNWHKATAAGLEPGEEYAYRVTCGGGEYSRVYGFDTDAASGGFQFVVFSDAQVDVGSGSGMQDSNSYWPNPLMTVAQGWYVNVERFSNAFPAANLYVSAGDQVEGAYDGSIFKSSLAEYRGFFAHEALRGARVAPSVGNHDDDADLFEWHYNLPNVTPNEAGVERSAELGNYWYRYNDVLFVNLSTFRLYPFENSESDKARDKFAAHFDATLKAATEANPDAKWLVVTHHKSTTSHNNRQDSYDVRLWESAVAPLMDKYGVDVVFSGHEHTYSRSWIIKGLEKVEGIDYSKNEVESPDGTLYFTLNTASGIRYYDMPEAREDYESFSPVWVDGKPWYVNVAHQIKAPQFMVVDVTENGMAFTLYRVDTMEAVDGFSIVK